MIEYEKYFYNALALNSAEKQAQERLLPKIPEDVIDVHVHMADEKSVNMDQIPAAALNHMMTTFPVNTNEQSAAIDETLMTGKSVNKLRFANAFKGVLHKSVNTYLINTKNDNAKTALFGVSESSEDIDYTISELESGNYAGLKMYYMATDPPKKNLYEYFPRDVLSAAERLGVPIILHLPKTIYGSMDELGNLQANFPNLKVMLAHIGVVHTVRNGLDQILKNVSQMENVFVDTSGIHEAEVVARALKYLGKNKLLYGSDEPLNLIRAIVYENPDLGPRLLTDYPYHWVDKDEQAKYRSLGDGKFMHSHWQQLSAIDHAVELQGYTETEKKNVLTAIFETNAKRLFGF